MFCLIIQWEPPSKGHIRSLGPSHFVTCREAVLFSEVEMYCIYAFGNIGSVPFREVVPFLECPLLEVLLYSEPYNYMVFLL